MKLECNCLYCGKGYLLKQYSTPHLILGQGVCVELKEWSYSI